MIGQVKNYLSIDIRFKFVATFVLQKSYSSKRASILKTLMLSRLWRGTCLKPIMPELGNTSFFRQLNNGNGGAI